MKNQGKQIHYCEGIMQKHAPVILGGEVCDSLLDRCNDVFGLAMKKCYSDFVVIGQPIMTRVEIDELVEVHEGMISNHYHTMFAMMGFDKKKGMTRNKHLTQTGHCNRQVFYSFLAMSRQINRNKMLNWDVISSGANYRRCLGDVVNRRST